MLYILKSGHFSGTSDFIVYVEQHYPLHCGPFVLGIDFLIVIGSEGDCDSQREEAILGWRGNSQTDVELAVQSKVITENSKAKN